MWLWEVFNVNCPSPYSFPYPVLPSPNSVSHSFSIFHFQIHITNVLFILPPLTSHMVLFWFPDFEGTSVWTHILTELLLVLYKFIKFVLWQVQIIGLQGKEQDMVTGKRKKICTFIPLEWERPKAGIPSNKCRLNYFTGLLAFPLLAPIRNIAQDFMQILLTMPSRTRYIQLRDLAFIFLIYLLLL